MLQVGLLVLESHQTKLVDCSYPAYYGESRRLHPQSHLRSWWIVHTQPTKRARRLHPQSHQRKLVDCSYPAYEESPATPSPIPPTKLVGFGGRAGCRSLRSRLSMNKSPTALVGFGGRAGCRSLRSRLGMNKSPTALVGFGERAGCRSLRSRLGMNNPPTAASRPSIAAGVQHN